MSEPAELVSAVNFTAKLLLRALIVAPALMCIFSIMSCVSGFMYKYVWVKDVCI